MQYLFILTLLLSTSAQAACPGSQPVGTDCVDTGAVKEITAFSTCRKITNAHASGKALMIPINSSTEWSTFYGATTAGVTVTNCCPHGNQVFVYTGADQTFTPPANCTTLTVKAWGAGGTGSNNTDGYGGLGGGGGYVTATLNGASGSYVVMVGQGGVQNGTRPATYGGGGASDNSAGGQGGGRSALRKAGVDLITAGAGGGGGYGFDTGVRESGGGGGGLTGGMSATSIAGGGGTQSSSVAGAGGGTAGAQYTGANGSGFNGGAGGGWYGGGSGGFASSRNGGGGGGSSYYGGAGVTGGSTIASPSQQTAANNADADYAAGVGAGTGLASTGQAGHGRVVIIY